MLRGLLIIAAAAVVALTGSAQRAAPAKSDAGSDVRFLMSEIRRIHPNPFHATPEPVFQAAADDLAARAPSLSQDQLLDELMRFVNLLGERDGHSGIFTLDSGNTRTLHVYPLYLYKFSDGLFVVSAPRNKSLVGSRLLAIDGMPVDGIEQKVRPLVPRDNDATRTDRFMSFMLTGEVLHGLGLRPGVGPARFTLQKPGGAAQDVTIAPVTAAAYVNIMQPYFPTFVYALPKRSKPLYLRRRGQDHYVTTLEHGRAVYVGYNRVLGSTGPDARKLLRLVKKKKFRRVIVDVRLNPGGDNHTYVDLLRALRSKRVNKKGRLVVLIGRSTFSAAQNFITELERKTRAVFVGETSGGSPNLYGDVEAVALPTVSVRVNIAEIYWQKSFAGDPRVAIEPKIPVALSSKAFFAGKDPVLAAALRYRAG
jgi:Peptidase family S41